VEFSTADLSDAHPETVHLVEPLFREYGGVQSFWGSVETVQTFEDNTLVRESLEQQGHGRVLVVDGGGSLRCALLGGRLGQLAKQNGWSGLLINGGVRDSVELARIAIGVRALNTTPLRSSKARRGVVGVTLKFAGAEFEPGMFLYADSDGILLADRSLL
jgi:regulator of ribonuclease activity A